MFDIGEELSAVNLPFQPHIATVLTLSNKRWKKVRAGTAYSLALEGRSLLLLCVFRFVHFSRLSSDLSTTMHHHTIASFNSN
jgi:hypothetical protein